MQPLVVWMPGAHSSTWHTASEPLNGVVLYYRYVHLQAAEHWGAQRLPRVFFPTILSGALASYKLGGRWSSSQRVTPRSTCYLAAWRVVKMRIDDGKLAQD